MEQAFEAAGMSMKRRGAGFEEHISAMRCGLGFRTRSASQAASTEFPKPRSARSRSGQTGPG